MRHPEQISYPYLIIAHEVEGLDGNVALDLRGLAASAFQIGVDGAVLIGLLRQRADVGVEGGHVYVDRERGRVACLERKGGALHAYHGVEGRAGLDGHGALVELVVDHRLELRDEGGGRLRVLHDADKVAAELPDDANEVLHVDVSTAGRPLAIHYRAEFIGEQICYEPFLEVLDAG